MIISFDEVYPLWCATERNLGEFDTHSAVCECSHHLPFYTCVVWYWYMKVVLGFVLIKSEYHSVSLGSFSCRFHSSYFQWLVPGAYCRVCVWVLFCLVFTVWEIHWFYLNLVPYCNWSSLFSYQVFTTLKSEPYSCISTINSIHSRFSPLSLSYHSPLPSVYLLWTLLIVILMFLRLSGTICFGALQARGRQWTGHHNHSNHCIIQVWLERDTEAFMVVDTHNRQL